jgi:serpin B
LDRSCKVKSAGGIRLQRPARRGRAGLSYRRFGIESLEARRLLSGLSFLPTPAYVPTAPNVTHSAVAASLSPAQLSAETAAGQSIDAFAESLYGQIQSEPGGSGNLFLSPASIATALAMTYAGAQGETATQIAAALHTELDADTLAGDFGSLIADLNSAGQNGAGGNNFSLSAADALWGQQGFSFMAPFLNLMQADFDGGLHQVDFVNAAEAARQTINNWVTQETNNKIQNLVPEGALNDMTRLVLTNALYFNGQWATPFNASLTQIAAFTLGSGGVVQVPTMDAANFYPYMQSDGYQVLELPYEGDRLAMDVILPSAATGLAGLNASQLPADLGNWLQGLAPQQVAVSLPKFQMTAQFNLIQPLEALGVTDAFSSHADFSGISTSAPLSISAVVHKAFINVDEAGTEAAAATGIGVGITAIVAPITPPIVFNADHPFLILIRDTQSGSVLFMGQVANPLAAGGDSNAPALPGSQATPAVLDPPPSPASVQLALSSAASTNLNNSSPAAAPQFVVSGLSTPPAGDSGEVILYADGMEIGEASVTGSLEVVTANGTMTLIAGSHKITAVEAVTSPAKQGTPAETVDSPVSPAETIKVLPKITSINLSDPFTTSEKIFFGFGKHWW